MAACHPPTAHYGQMEPAVLAKGLARLAASVDPPTDMTQSGNTAYPVPIKSLL